MSNPIRHKFFIYAPDNTEEGTFALRLSVREKHVVGIKAAVATGTLRVGGALLTPESLHAPPEEQKMIGSTLIVEAESIEDVKALVENDIYYTSGVWDKEKIVILPMLAGTPIP